MPEGPEIRRQADRLHRALAGRTAVRVFFAFERLRGAGARLSGQTVVSVSSRGKAMLTRFEDGTTVYTHNQLYGRWMIRDANHRPRTRRQLRLAIDSTEKSALLYSASTIDVLDPADVDTHPFLASLGPDALDEATKPIDVRRRLRSERFANRRLGALYLDQSFVAGLGNYLRSEILFVAGVHPERRPRDLDEDEVKRLARATLRITRRAYETGGITNLPSDARRRKAKGEPRRSYRHFVFARSGRTCRQCGARVVRQELGGRRIYVCPTCQPEPDT